MDSLLFALPSPAKSLEQLGGACDKFRSEFLPHRSTLDPRVVGHRNLHLKRPRFHGLEQNTPNLQTVWGGHAHLPVSTLAGRGFYYGAFSGGWAPLGTRAEEAAALALV